MIFSAHWLHEFSPGTEFEMQFSQSRNPSGYVADESYVPGSRADQETVQYVAQLNEAAQNSEELQTDVSILDRSLRMDWTLAAFANQSLSFGGGYSAIRLHYFWENFLNDLEQDELIVFFDKAPDDLLFRRKLRQVYF